ncbi:Osmotically inducible protein OsmY [Candidatus Nitrotoga sp. HW29]|uniref:BON domain-containing protein n=1 Tax=Candidatus Nitrotoga sp. HW29 TaxID=2886963 RepID=UPI001EF35589|nr:BON domain-containing protein [Candidatus Nitrotoga sp. HW29]CAH1905673.1 Osmotically inducible protein OsmY [Candidatus Nitrotoga sp. HW29]
MKIKLAATWLAIGMMLAPAVGFTTDSNTDHSGPVAFVKDSVITTKIKTKLAAETHLSSLKEIKVDTDKNGAVFLSGMAHSQIEVDKAVSIARDTKGVTTVHNDIRIMEYK